MMLDEQEIERIIRAINSAERELLEASSSPTALDLQVLGKLKASVDSFRTTIWCAMTKATESSEELHAIIEQHRLRRATELLRTRRSRHGMVERRSAGAKLGVLHFAAASYGGSVSKSL